MGGEPTSHVVNRFRATYWRYHRLTSPCLSLKRPAGVRSLAVCAARDDDAALLGDLCDRDRLDIHKLPDAFGPQFTAEAGTFRAAKG